jgi:glycosyltransferase involved in cell wall biosynthesis
MRRAPDPDRLRIAFFLDQVFWRDGDGLSTDEAFILFASSFAERAEVTIIGRLAQDPGRAPYRLDPAIRLCPLPPYGSVGELWRSDPRRFGKIRRSVAAMREEWDALVVGGPHPIGQMIASDCAHAGMPVVPLVRQNLVAWQKTARRGLKRVLAVAAAQMLDWHFRRLARGRTVLTVGHEMADRYRRAGAEVHDHFSCLIDEGRFAELGQLAGERQTTRLLYVGRLSPEKGVGVLLAAMALLGEEPEPFSLDIVGAGPELDALCAAAERLGLSGRVSFLGHVPFGEALFSLYRRAGALVVPSFTEGFPQVINEALAAGLPTIATAVGGIPAVIEPGSTGLLVPPGDPAALAAAVRGLAGDAELRRRLAERGRAFMAAHTLEANRDRVMQVLAREVLRDAA